MWDSEVTPSLTEQEELGQPGQGPPAGPDSYQETAHSWPGFQPRGARGRLWEQGRNRVLGLLACIQGALWLSPCPCPCLLGSLPRLASMHLPPTE